MSLEAKQTDEGKIEEKKSRRPGAKSEPERIGVHCVAGLGRAPMMVALGLVAHGLEATEAIDLIKNNR